MNRLFALGLFLALPSCSGGTTAGDGAPPPPVGVGEDGAGADGAVLDSTSGGAAETEEAEGARTPPRRDPPADTGAVSGPGEPMQGWPPMRVVTTDIACTSDADCVPAGCCHADTCVAASDAPECKDVMCTADCRAGTLDCGGGCLCQEGRCAARIAVSFEAGPTPAQ